MQELLKEDYTGLDPLMAANSQIKLADAILKAEQAGRHTDLSTLQAGIGLTQRALVQAQQLEQFRIQASALGKAGELWLAMGDQKSAEKLLIEALGTAQLVEAKDLAYQWQALLGGMYQEKGENQQAIEAYRGAIANTEAIRQDLMSLDSEKQYRFLEEVRLHYRSYMGLLLNQLSPDLEEVVRISEELQLAELENYLRCGRLARINIEQREFAERPNFIHIIDLGTTVEVIQQS